MKTHCKRGHEYTPENTIWNPQPGGKRTRKCRACANASNNLNRDRDADKAARQRARIPGLRERIARLQAELRSLEGIPDEPQGVPELMATCTKLLPGGIIDDTTYSQIEDALDAIEAPMTGEGGRYLKIAERISALALSRPEQS